MEATNSTSAHLLYRCRLLEGRCAFVRSLAFHYWHSSGQCTQRTSTLWMCAWHINYLCFCLAICTNVLFRRNEMCHICSRNVLLLLSSEKERHLSTSLTQKTNLKTWYRLWCKFVSFRVLGNLLGSPVFLYSILSYLKKYT